LTPALVQFTGASDLPDMLEGLVNNRYVLTPAAAPLIFQTAAAGDAVALDLIRWAGQELGELANAVIRQLDFQEVSFEVVQVGSMYAGSPLLSRVMEQTILSEAPRARLVHLTHPPVAGAVLLGMEAAGFAPTPWVRTLLTESARMGFINQG
jgi:N-acetylglucosamine kinase-like BadF-type ATPase